MKLSLALVFYFLECSFLKHEILQAYDAVKPSHSIIILLNCKCLCRLGFYGHLRWRMNSILLAAANPDSDGISRVTLNGEFPRNNLEKL